MNTESKGVVIFGVTDFANQVSYYFKNDSNFKIVAYTIDKVYNEMDTFLGLPVIDFEVIQEKFPPHLYDMFIAVGYNNLNKTREIKFKEAKEKGYKLVSYVCTKNTIWPDLELGENSYIMEGNVIQFSVKIANNVIIGIGNHIGHNVIIEENCFITSGVMIGGFSRVMKNSFIGMSSTIRDKISIEENNILGAGSIILKDTRKNSSYISASTGKAKANNNFIKNFI